MDYLRRFAEEYGLERIISIVSERPNIQGAILTLDDWWLTAWRYQENGQAGDWDRWLRRWGPWGPGPYSPLGAADCSSIRLPWIPMRTPDLSWRPPHWDMYCDMAGIDEKAPPVRLIICLRPPSDRRDFVLPEIPRSELPVSFEVRPIARLSSIHRQSTRPVVGGISVGSGAKDFGTLGGIVEDQSGLRYGMTCAHVFPAQSSVEQPALKDDALSLAIGTSSKSIELHPCRKIGPCNPYSKSSHITSVDTRLVNFGSGVGTELEILTIGPLAGVVDKDSMTPGQEVTFVGRSSGSRIAEIGGLAVFYRLQSYCFRDLFEIRWQSFIRSLLGPVVQAGDSGAWVCAETDQGMAWCGQVLGEDRHVGYAAFAENTLTEWSEKEKKELRVK